MGEFEDEMAGLRGSSSKSGNIEDENLHMGLLLGQSRFCVDLAHPQHPTFVEFLGNPEFAALPPQSHMLPRLIYLLCEPILTRSAK